MAGPSTQPLVPALDGDLEPGDRFEVPLVAGETGSGRLLLPRFLQDAAIPVDVIEDEHGHRLDRPLEQTLEPSAAPQDPTATFWLEYQAPGRFRLVVEPGEQAATAALKTEQAVPVELDAHDWDLVHRAGGPGASLAEMELAQRA